METSERRSSQPEHISTILERVIEDIRRKAEENEREQKENNSGAIE